MTDLILPPALTQAKTSFRYLDSTGVSRGVYTGVPQTTNYGGDRIGASIDFTAMGGKQSSEQSKRAQLQAFIMALRGKTNRVYLTDNSYTRRGSFPATELFTNTDFNGTTGWTPGADASLSASDQVLRVKRAQNAASGAAYAQSSTFSVSAHVPYAGRVVLGQIRGNANALVTPQGTTDNSLFYGTANLGYQVCAALWTSTTGGFYLDNTGASISIAGDYFDVLFTSASRCMLADGGGNYLLQSETFGTTWAPSGATISSNTAVAPDGQATADDLVENSATSAHFVEQSVSGFSASAADYTFSIPIKAFNRSWVLLQIIESTGSTAAQAYFNAATGALGSTPSAGAGWANIRVAITNLGSSWYMCTLTARKTSAATTLTARILSVTADNGSTSFLGNGLSAHRLWRGTLSQSSIPTRLTSTTTVAVAASSQTGLSIYVKGLPASTSGLLLIGDWIEIDGQLKMVTAPLDSDGAGLGYLQFSPPLRRSVADNTPIIVHKPMGRFMLAGDSSGWSNEPGVFSQASIDLEEAFG